MSLRKTDQYGLPLPSKVWVRFESKDNIIVRNDGADPYKNPVRIHSYGLQDTVDCYKGMRSYRKFGTTPGGRSYNIVTHYHADGTIYRKMEVFGAGESHVKVRCNNGEKAKVLRKHCDSFFSGVLDLGPQIDKSFLTPRTI